MPANLPDPLARFQQPEYTGENRCIPCTAGNVGIAVFISILIIPFFGIWAGLALFIFSGVVIYLRGYLVPGTPELTKRYFPDWVLAKFDKVDRPETSGEEPHIAVDIEAVLQSADAVQECRGGRDLCLTKDFHDAWSHYIDKAKDDDTGRAVLADVFDVKKEELTFEEYGNAFVASVDGFNAGRWESRAAFMADVGAAQVLADRSPDWKHLNELERAEVLGGLRLFLESCPACGGPVEFGEDTVESCCRSFEVIAVTCESCNSRLFEVDRP